MRFPELITVNAIGFADAYGQLMHKCMKEGKLKRRFYGVPVDTKDIVSTTSILDPETKPMLHQDFPTKGKHAKVYIEQLKRGYDWCGQGFEYNYGDRYMHYPKSRKECGEYYDGSKDQSDFIDQFDILKNKISGRIAKGGECLVSNRDEAITWVPGRDLFIGEDQPCFQRVQLFVWQHPTKRPCQVEK